MENDELVSMYQKDTLVFPFSKAKKTIFHREMSSKRQTAQAYQTNILSRLTAVLVL